MNGNNLSFGHIVTVFNFTAGKRHLCQYQCSFFQRTKAKTSFQPIISRPPPKTEMPRFTTDSTPLHIFFSLQIFFAGCWHIAIAIV